MEALGQGLAVLEPAILGIHKPIQLVVLLGKVSVQVERLMAKLALLATQYLGTRIASPSC